MSTDMTRAGAEVVGASVRLASLLLSFGRVKRVTMHEDGETFESDAEHTVMLGVLACAFAKQYASHLDTGKIAEFALVHDLVEAYAGDMNTFGIATNVGKEDKAAREHAALLRIKEEYGTVYPWVGDTIERYEQLDTPEACFVKFFDKVLPKLTHLINCGAAIRHHGQTKEKHETFHREQYEFIAANYGKGHPELAALYLAVNDQVLKECFN